MPIEPNEKQAPAMRALRGLAVALVASGALQACSPRVAVEAPKEPITINLNINLDAEVRVKLEEQAQQDIKQNPGVF